MIRRLIVITTAAIVLLAAVGCSVNTEMGGSPVSGAPGCYRDSDSFEPRDAVKGDVARMIFYTRIIYLNSCLFFYCKAFTAMVK